MEKSTRQRLAVAVGLAIYLYQDLHANSVKLKKIKLAIKLTLYHVIL